MRTIRKLYEDARKQALNTEELELKWHTGDKDCECPDCIKGKKKMQQRLIEWMVNRK